MSERKRVVVTGLALVTSLGIDVEESWQKALSGISGIHRLTYPLSEKSAVQAVGEVSPSDCRKITQEFEEEVETEGERKTLFALWASKRALEDAGLTDRSGTRSRYGVAFASGLGINRLEDLQKWLTVDKKFDVVKFGKEHSQVTGSLSSEITLIERLH